MTLSGLLSNSKWIASLAFLLLWAPNGYSQASIDSIEVDTASIVAFIDVAVVRP
jgi:hypothetical protein